MTIKRAAAYVRVSTTEQAGELSLHEQERRILAFAKRNDYQIVKVYRDRASGGTVKRPGLDQMLHDAEQGLLETIIVLDTTRLFRCIESAIGGLLQIDDCRVELVAVTQSVYDPWQGESA